jgi:branched-subunit amino acid transport protein
MSIYVLAIIVGATAVTYGSRLIGLYAGSWELSERNQRILAYVPIGAFTAIVTLGFTDPNGELGARIPAAIVAGVLALKQKPLWLCLIAGLAVYAALRMAFGL